MNQALPNNGEKIVKVEIVLHHDASSDLSYLVKKFMMDSRENEHIIECPQGGHLTVDAHNLQVSHKSVAVNPMMQEDESEGIFNKIIAFYYFVPTTLDT